MTQNQIISLIAASAGSLIVFAFQETIKETLKKLLAGLKPKQITFVFISLIAFVFIFISVAGFSILPTEDKTSEAGDSLETEVEVKSDAKAKTKSDAEVYTDLAKEGLEKGEEMLRNKRAKDSIRAASKEKIWVYQIGTAKDSEADAWEAANELQGIGNISIFKESRKSYLVICDSRYSEKKAKDSLNSFIAKTDTYSPGIRVKVIDLMSFCHKRKGLTETGKITKKKHEQSFKCLTCN